MRRALGIASASGLLVAAASYWAVDSTPQPSSAPLAGDSTPTPTLSRIAPEEPEQATRGCVHRQAVDPSQGLQDVVTWLRAKNIDVTSELEASIRDGITATIETNLQAALDGQRRSLEGLPVHEITIARSYTFDRHILSCGEQLDALERDHLLVLSNKDTDRILRSLQRRFPHLALDRYGFVDDDGASLCALVVTSAHNATDSLIRSLTPSLRNI